MEVPLKNQGVSPLTERIALVERLSLCFQSGKRERGYEPSSGSELFLDIGRSKARIPLRVGSRAVLGSEFYDRIRS